MTARRPILTVLAALAVLTALSPPAEARAGKRVFAPAAANSGVLVFKVHGVTPRRVRRGYLQHRGERRPVASDRLREGARRGVVRVRAPRAAGAAARLVVLVTPPGDTGRTSCGLARVEEGLGNFGVGSWPGPCWRPYADDSPFNQRLPRSPRLDPRSDAIVNRVTGWGEPAELRAGVAGTRGDWQHPIYYSDGGDPWFEVHCLEDWGTCEVEGMRVRIPDRAEPAAGSDGHLTVVDQDSGWEYDFWQVRRKPRGGGRLAISWGGRTRIDGDGLGSDANAAHYGSLAGIIRAEEMRRGRIDHALFMLVRCDSGRKVYPAQGLGLECDDKRGAPSQGTRFQLDMSPGEIDSLRIPEWRKTILRAMAEYGLYVGDTTGGTPWNIWFESGASYESFGRPDPMVGFAKRAGIRRSSDGSYYFDWASGVNWRRHLRVVDACVAERSC
ncbi:MAG: hypothetical protein JW895_16255 [Thermoleophilaceae bacterium]|nr:hypothetical protein [Thermoleophilaceae bacterium]